MHAPPATPQERPRIGLALGGGAARGWAHIGVLRTLVANGIVPDVVVGTSIGAVVGGLWAADRLDELESWATSLTRRKIISMLDFSLRGAGIIGGGRLARRLRQEIDVIDIADLPIRFAAVATERGNGNEVWLTRGRLGDAMRASYAVPGIFSPVDIGGRWLMDGTLSNPVPVSVARALGADIVIAVSLNTELAGRGRVIKDHGTAEDEPAAAPARRRLRPRILRRRIVSDDDDGPRGISNVVIDAFNITQERISRTRVATDPPDVMIGPHLARIGLFEFDRAEEIIAAGRAATERALDDIRDALAG